MRFNFFTRTKNIHQGFTLVEFVVIISIFSIMAAVALINFNGFRTNIGLTNLAHDIALTIRQAQVFGWATQSENASGTGLLQLDLDGNPVRYAQGVYFSRNNPNAFDTQFILYEKKDPNTSQFFMPNADTVVDTIKIQGPSHIAEILTSQDKADLALRPGTPKLIPSAGVTPVGGNFSVAFSRPRPEAIFFDGFSPLISQTSDYVGIYITADSDCAPTVSCTTASHVIIISRFGEIEVQ